MDELINWLMGWPILVVAGICVIFVIGAWIASLEKRNEQ